MKKNRPLREKCAGAGKKVLKRGSSTHTGRSPQKAETERMGKLKENYQKRKQTAFQLLGDLARTSTEAKKRKQQSGFLKPSSGFISARGPRLAETFTFSKKKPTVNMPAKPIKKAYGRGSLKAHGGPDRGRIPPKIQQRGTKIAHPGHKRPTQPSK